MLKGASTYSNLMTIIFRLFIIVTIFPANFEPAVESQLKKILELSEHIFASLRSPYKSIFLNE
jgi:hypothetical protein